MSVHKIANIEVFEIDQNIDQYTRKEREEFINELFKQEYQGKEISYLLNGQEIKALIDYVTRENLKAKKHGSFKSEKRKEFNKKQDIVFSGDYEKLITSMDFQGTYKEQKTGQNKYHKQTNLWHNYNKYILVQKSMYKVVLNIRQDKNRFYIHNVKLKEVDASTIDLMYGKAINPNQLSTSSINIISNHATDLQKNLEIPVEWIDDHTLKMEIEDPINKLSTIAVCKTIKKSMEFYLTDGQQVESVKEQDLDVQILHQIYEKVEEVTGLVKDDFDQEYPR